MGLLLPLLARERHDRVHDNICGALARLLMASPTRKPDPQVRIGALGNGRKLRRVGARDQSHLSVQVLAALLHALPLKEDLEEWVTIGHLFSFLYQNSPEQVTQCRSPRRILMIPSQ